MRQITLAIRALARWAFAALIITLPFRWRLEVAARPVDTIYKDYTDFLLFLPDLFMVVTLALWVASLVLERRRVNLGPLFISVPMAGLTATAIITGLVSIDPFLSLYHSIRIVLLDALYLYVINEIESFIWVMAPLACQIAIQSGASIGQFYQQHSLGLQSLGEYELDPLWGGVSVVIGDGVRVLRAYGLTDHPNILGGCMALAMIQSAANILEARTRAMIMNGLAFGLGAMALLLTFSRSAYGAFAVGIIFITVALWQTRQMRALARLAIVLSATAILCLPFGVRNANALGVRAQGAISATEDALEIRSLAERSALNQAANLIFSDHPLAGVGVGSLPEAVRLRFPNFDFYDQPAHIALLDAAAETGIIGALFYAGLIGMPWAALATHREKLNWTPALIGVSAILLAITFIGFFDYYTWMLVPGRLWQWLAWGLWSAEYQKAKIN